MGPRLFERVGPERVEVRGLVQVRQVGLEGSPVEVVKGHGCRPSGFGVSVRAQALAGWRWRVADGLGWIRWRLRWPEEVGARETHHATAECGSRRARSVADPWQRSCPGHTPPGVDVPALGVQRLQRGTSEARFDEGSGERLVVGGTPAFAGSRARRRWLVGLSYATSVAAGLAPN